MVVQDFDLLFEMLDTDFKGHLTVEEVQLFDESTFFDSLDLLQILASIKTVYGDENGMVTREKFGHLLREMERRRQLEEKVSWDFKALDMDKDGRISLQSALFLFKTVHGHNFSIKLWNSFLSSRHRPEDEVSFDEIRLFLCNIPTFEASGEQEFNHFSNQVRENQKERDYNLHKSLLAWQVSANSAFSKTEEAISHKMRLPVLINICRHLKDFLYIDYYSFIPRNSIFISKKILLFAKSLKQLLEIF